MSVPGVSVVATRSKLSHLLQSSLVGSESLARPLDPRPSPQMATPEEAGSSSLPSLSLLPLLFEIRIQTSSG